MKTMTRRQMIGLATLACAGCASQTTTRPALEKTNLTVGSVQSTTAAGLYLAAQRGYFAAAGLNVRIVPTAGSGPVMTDLINGTLDMSFGNYVSFILAQAEGVTRLRILAEGSSAVPREDEIVIAKTSPIRTVQGLRGKVIAVNALAGIGELLVSSVLAENQVPPSFVKFVAVPFPAMDSALSAHRVDAAWMNEPFFSQAEISSGAQGLADCDQGATQNFPISGIAVTDVWARKYPRTAAAFVTALDKGQALADTNRQAVEQVLPHYIKVSKAAAALIATGSYPVGAVNQVQMQRVADVMHEFGMLKAPFNVSPMIG
jgi:NitT/TauT family transport system substrate-binding protein